MVQVHLIKSMIMRRATGCPACSDCEMERRAPPWLPALVYAPMIVALLLAHADAGPALIVTATLSGVLLWSLLEYALHRFGLHLPQHSRAWRVAYFLVHGHHHAQPRDSERLVATLPQSALLLALVYGLASLASTLIGLDRSHGSAPVAALIAGTTFGYLLYEGAHYAIHHARSRRGPLRLIARLHGASRRSDEPLRHQHAALGPRVLHAAATRAVSRDAHATTRLGASARRALSARRPRPRACTRPRRTSRCVRTSAARGCRRTAARRSRGSS